MVRLVEDMVGDHPARPVLVLANNASAGGLTKASVHGVPTAVVDHREYAGDREAFQNAIHKMLVAADVDLVCLAGFMRILSADFTKRWQGRMINIHPSLLPKYKGLHTHARALEAGDVQHGCTVHEVTAELDDGPILGQGVVPIQPDDSASTLAERVLVMEHTLYPAVLRRFAAGDRSKLNLGLAL